MEVSRTLDKGRVAQLPSSKRRGGRDINKDAAKPPCDGADGVVRHDETFSQPDHPVCGVKVGFAAFFLMPQPPLLFQEGSYRPPTRSYVFRFMKASRIRMTEVMSLRNSDEAWRWKNASSLNLVR